MKDLPSVAMDLLAFPSVLYRTKSYGMFSAWPGCLTQISFAMCPRGHVYSTPNLPVVSHRVNVPLLMDMWAVSNKHPFILWAEYLEDLNYMHVCI